MKRAARAALRGELSLLAPEILVQMLSLARATGCLVFRRGGPRCRLYMRDGRITFAQLTRGGGGRGSALERMEPTPRQDVCDALAVALGWRTGSFTFERGAHPDDGVATLDADPQEILLECLSRIRAAGGGDEEGRV
jgi:hypothetical protein